MISENGAKALQAIVVYWDKLSDFERGKLIGSGEALISIYGGAKHEAQTA